LFIFGRNAGKTAMFRLVIGLILVALPFAELALLVKTAKAVGFWAMLGMVVGAGVLGAFVLSRAGSGALRRAAQAIDEGRPPMADTLDGAFLMMAGMLLITPGFLTDAMALLLLLPPLRRALARWAVRRVLARGGLDEQTATPAGDRSGGTSHASPRDRGSGPIIEGGFERLSEKPSDPGATKP
jgi:UPF0716 protein FxsA